MFKIKKLVAPLLFSAAIVPASVSAQAEFDFDEGNAAVEVLIPSIVPVVYQDVSDWADDPSLVLRFTTLSANSWFDAIAPYHPTATGIYSDIERQPEEERTDENRNIAMMYANYRVLNSLMPSRAATWRNMMLDAGLDPDDDQTATDNPVGIGNTAGNAVVGAREMDGMNQLGNEGDCRYNCTAYADYTGYEPVNTADTLNDPGRWQPGIRTNNEGLYNVQQFVTPQYALTEPYAIEDLDEHTVEAPAKSDPDNPGYQEQADEVLEMSANLTEEQKVKSEFFNDKFQSLGFSPVFLAQSRGLSLEEFVFLDLLANISAFDAGIAVWSEKRRHDAVRPFSAIGYLYGDDTVTAWGGPGQGTVDNMPADQWRGYLQAANHPEYPSASATFCSAHAEAMRLAMGDELGWTVDIPQGASRVEPGMTPSSDMQVTWDTWTEFEQDCGISRVHAGVHFMPSVDVAPGLGRPIGQKAYDFVLSHINGTVE